MSEDSRFGGTSGTPAVGTPANQDYGFFAPAPAGAPSQSGGPPNQFAPAASPAAAPPPAAMPPPPVSGQFGPPPQVPFGAPTAYGPPPYPPVQRRGLPVWAIVAICVPAGLVVTAILAAIAIPVFLSQRSTPVMPESLGGVSRSTDPSMAQAVDAVHKQLSKQNPGRKVAAAGYGSLDAGYLLMGLGGRVDGAREFSDFGVTGAVMSFGDVRCGTSPNNGSLCLLTGTRGTIEVAQFGAGAVDLTQLAGVTNKTWAAQPFGDCGC